MTRNIIRIACCTLLLLAGTSLHAQQGLRIASLFDKYSRQKGATYVVLTHIETPLWDATLYKSLQLKRAEKALPDIYTCLVADSEHAQKIKEVIIDGQIQSAYYSLPPQAEGVNRFILFRLDEEGEAALLYIEGDIKDEALLRSLYGFK
ncbi:MAG: hypothetical protein LBL97_06490 [Prevotellaceae bacterium]|jgi:hypothetical protein|nr:hypothetical protein [Prevotellaceae bacterium]